MPAPILMEIAKWLNNGEPVNPEMVQFAGLIILGVILCIAIAYILFWRKDELLEAYMKEEKENE